MSSVFRLCLFVLSPTTAMVLIFYISLLTETNKFGRVFVVFGFFLLWLAHAYGKPSILNQCFLFCSFLKFPAAVPNIQSIMMMGPNTIGQGMPAPLGCGGAPGTAMDIQVQAQAAAAAQVFSLNSIFLFNIVRYLIFYPTLLNSSSLQCCFFSPQ